MDINHVEWQVLGLSYIDENQDGWETIKNICKEPAYQQYVPLQVAGEIQYRMNTGETPVWATGAIDYVLDTGDEFVIVWSDDLQI